MKKIAVIPARSGSKGLADKNIIDICGKPLMSYTIEAALKCNMFNAVIVSTDSLKYKEIAEKCGAEVYMRGGELSSDTATTYAVLEDLLHRLPCNIDYFVLLQPTSPMRTEKHICEACRLFEENRQDFDFLVSVKEAEFPSSLVRPVGDDKSLKYFDDDFSVYRRQNYKEYSPNGAIYIAKPDAYFRQKHFFGARSRAFIMNKYESVDIDDELDYELACILMKKLSVIDKAR
ncbi:MAG: acylneuraminate cytidylyltransferase family protein [Oscillospiraceae bacterium]|nr:acylneuraminate cytidylyltransferase family protein [Oscillospiraceae bacterium]